MVVVDRGAAVLVLMTAGAFTLEMMSIVHGTGFVVCSEIKSPQWK